MRVAIVRTLAKIRDSASLPALMDFLNDPELAVRQAAVSAFIRFGDLAVPYVTQVFREKEKITLRKRVNCARINALFVLAKMGGDDFVQELIELDSDETEDLNVRGVAVDKIGERTNAAAIPVLMELLDNEKLAWWYGDMRELLHAIAYQALKRFELMPEVKRVLNKWEKDQPSTKVLVGYKLSKQP